MMVNVVKQIILMAIVSSYTTSFGMDASETIENKIIRDLRMYRIKTVNSMQKMTQKHLSDKEFLAKVDDKVRLLDMLDRDIKQSEEKLKEQSKSKL